MSSAPVPGPYPVAAAKKRPSAWWWVFGGGLLVAAIACFAIFLGLLISTLHDSIDNPHNVTFRPDGSPHAVTLGADKGFIWVDVGAAGGVDCRVADAATGEPLPLDTPSGRLTYNNWHDLATFPAGSGEVQVTCTGGSFDRVRVGPAPHVGRVVAYALLMIVLPAFLGLVGAVILIVTIVRLVSRPKTYPGFAGGYPGYAGRPPDPPSGPPYSGPPYPGPPGEEQK